ncbi:MAG: TonB-dependent receptor [Gammaproteobacteria bacterium]|nr:TonB-dependent receptor [Gammaproteobacteria bacterium]
MKEKATTSIQSVRTRIAYLFLTFFATSALIPVASAQVNTGDEEELIEEIITTGSRRKARSASDTPAPVDVIGADQLTNQGGNSVLDALSAVVPSFTAHVQPNSGTATSIRPANLRGMSPDATLVLVNGKRRHRAAVVVTASSSNGLARGSQPVDISTIPSIALKRVEVLRDGASAQYGADAIAGVINFIPRDDTDGGSIDLKYGQYGEGDGETVQLSGTYGMALGSSGHLNISAEFSEVDGTSRTVQRDDAAALIAAGNTDVIDPVQIWGSPEITDEIKLFINIGVDAGANSEFYAFGGYSEKRTDGTFFYRNPNNRGGTFHTSADPNGPNAGSNIRLVGDLTPEDGLNCLGGYDFVTGVRDEAVIGSPEDDAALAASLTDPNCWTFNEMFPGGFTPFFGSDLSDISGSTGLRGELNNGMTYDISVSAGRNEIGFDLVDSINASLGPATPLFFKAGFYVELENMVNVDISYPVDVAAFASPLNIAAGFEWRKEQFQIGVAQAETFEAGILGNPDLSSGINQGFEARLNGFAPFRPEIAGKNDRHNIAVYFDLEADVTDDLVLGAAVRFEDFSDFGNETTFKLAGLYHVSDAVTLRATYATGFRAPTIGQQNFSTITTTFGPDGTLVSSGTVPPTSGPALLRGGGQLQPETSDSFTVGFAYEPELFSVTLDYFNIDMEDRITQSAAQTLTPAEAAQLEAEGFSAAGLTSFRFFTNDFETSTEGIDVVVSLPLELTSGGASNLNFTGNWTENEVTANPSGLLGPTEIQQIEDGIPSLRANATLSHAEENWHGFVRLNYYGAYEEAHLNSLARLIDAGSVVTLDVEAGFDVSDNIELIIGAQNLLDEFPESNPFAGATGARYSITSPLGFNGGFYYGKVRFNF